MRRRNFYFFFIRISVVVSIKFSPFPLLQTCVCSVLWGSSRFPMLSVEAACAFAFSLGSEGLTSDRLELHWDLLPFRAFSFVLPGLTHPEGINPVKVLLDDRMGLGPVSEWNLHLTVWERKLVVAVAMITASPVGLVTFIFADAIFVFMSKSHHRNDVVDQQERGICDRIHPVKSFIMEGLHNCNVVRSSLHRITCDDVSCSMEDTLQKIIEYLHMVLHHIACDASTNESSVCLRQNVSLRCHSGGQRKYGSFEWEK